MSPLYYFLLVSCSSSHQILATPLVSDRRVRVSECSTFDVRFEAFTSLAACGVLFVTLPRRSLDGSSTPRCFISILTVLLTAFQFGASVTARSRELLVVAVRLATFFAPGRVLVTVFASCTILHRTQAHYRKA